MIKKDYNRDYRVNYGETMKEQTIEWFHLHPHYRSVYCKKWFQSHPDYHKEWRKYNLLHYREYQKQWSEKNHDKKNVYMKFYMREYRKNHVRN